MKSKSSFILKAALSLVLAVILLASTMTVGFSAIVDDLAKTGDDPTPFTSGEYLFLLPNNNWKLDGARFAAAFITTGDDITTWVDCTKVGSTDYYQVQVPDRDDYVKVIFARMNGSAAENNWNNKLNQTSDLNTSHFGSFNLVKIGNTNGWDGDQYFNSSLYITTMFIDPETYGNESSYAYIYKTDSVKVTGDWPGDSVNGWSDTYTSSTLNKSYHYKTFVNEIDSFKVILHNNAGSQTADSDEITLTPGYNYYKIDSKEEISTDYWKPIVDSINVYTASFDRNGHGESSPASRYVFKNDTLTEPTITSIGRTVLGWYTDNTYETQWNFGSGVTSDLNLVAKWSDYSAKEGQSFYFDYSYGTSFPGTPNFKFATALSSGQESDWIEGSPIAGLSHVLYANAPASGYKYIKVQSSSDSTIDSGWREITDAHANTITYIGTTFNGPALPYTEHDETSYGDGYTYNGRIYFDNTKTKWDISGSNKLYFVIGRENYQKMHQMSSVSNTSNLYYLDNNEVWGAGGLSNGYTYIAFALATTGKTGSYHPDDPDGVLNVSIACTTFISCYDISGRNKSFIGFGLNETAEAVTEPVLDFLWIRDSVIDGTGVTTHDMDSVEETAYLNDGNAAHEGDYLNRGIQLTVSGDSAHAKMNGYKMTNNFTSAISQSEQVLGGENSSTVTQYFARSSTVSIYDMQPLSGYTIRIKVGNGSWEDPTPDTGVNAGKYYYTFKVPGGTDQNRDYGIVPVQVVYSPIRNIKVGVAVMESTGVNFPDPLAGSVAKIGSVAIGGRDGALISSSTDAYTACIGTIAESDITAGNLTLTATPGTHSGLEFVGWYAKSNLTTPLSTTISNYSPNAYTPDTSSSDTTYLAVFRAPVTYNFIYDSRQGGTKTYSVAGADATYDELASESLATVSSGARNTHIVNIANSIATSKLANVFGKTTTFNTGSPTTDNPTFTVTISSTQSGKSGYHLSIYSPYNINSPAASTSWYSIDTGEYDSVIDVTSLTLDVYKEAGKPITACYGGVFLGWKEYSTTSNAPVGDFLSTQALYGLSLTGDLSIVPVFGNQAQKDALTAEWQGFVDKNEIGYEMTSESTGKIYNDSIVRFSFGNDTSKSYNQDDCGVIILAQTETAYGTGDYGTKFAAKNNKADLQAYVNTLSTRSGRSAKMSAGTYGESYAFMVQATSLSTLNRVNICQVLDYTKFNGGQYIVAAYYKDKNGNYQISENSVCAVYNVTDKTIAACPASAS